MSVVPLRIYFAVFAALLAMTALTVWVASHDYGLLNTPIALGIALFKATLVVLYFMHVRHASRLIWLAAAAGLLWLAILISFTLADFVSRPWEKVYGSAVPGEPSPRAAVCLAPSPPPRGGRSWHPGREEDQGARRGSARHRAAPSRA